MLHGHPVTSHWQLAHKRVGSLDVHCAWLGACQPVWHGSHSCQPLPDWAEQRRCPSMTDCPVWHDTPPATHPPTHHPSHSGRAPPRLVAMGAMVLGRMPFGHMGCNAIYHGGWFFTLPAASSKQPAAGSLCGSPAAIQRNLRLSVTSTQEAKPAPAPAPCA